MEETTEYQKLVATIDEIEGSSQKSPASVIDVSELIESQGSQKARTYFDILQTISEVESGGRRIREQPQRQAQTAPEAHIITSGVSQTPFQQGQVTQPGQKAEKQKSQFKFPFRKQEQPQPGEVLPKDTEEHRKESVASELGAIASRLSSSKPAIPELKKRKVNLRELILPNLSLSDQISELERIIEGLREHVFDDNHIDIVVQEVYGMQQVVNQEKKKLKGKPPTQNQLELSLWGIRDQRLAEATVLLQQSGVN